MNILFFGNTKYSVIVAKALHNEYGLSSVVTIPDRPVGRKKILTPSPVKQFAVDNKIKVLTFNRLAEKVIDEIRRSVIPSEVEESHTSESVKRDPSTRPAASVGMTWERPDFLVVADYGLILPKELLTIPKFAPLNVHHSLLPKYRGPSPAPTAILNGDKISGVTIIKMTGEVDAGPILAQKEYELATDETTDSLLTTLNTIGGELVVDVIKNYRTFKPLAQDESAASITKRLTKQDGYIDLTNPPSPQQLDRMIRAYYPWPTVWTKVGIRNQESGIRERIIKFLPGPRLQVEGGKPMSLKDFLNGYPLMKVELQKLFARD